MASLSWVRRLRSFFRPQVRTYRRSECRLDLEPLESRLAPTVYTWTGQGNDNHWTNPVNWGGSAPNGDPAAVDDLVFPAVARQYSTYDDLPLFNNKTPVINSITISGSNYTVTGTNGAQLQLGTAAGSGPLFVSQGVKNASISVDLALGAAGGSRQNFEVDNGADLTILGKLSGTTGAQLTKLGTGILVLSNDNSAFTGPIDDSQGILQITNAKALGDTSGSTTVEPGAQLQVSNVSGNIPESLLLNGAGVANDGALLNVAGTNTWTGNIEMDSNVTFGASAGSLDIKGQISDRGNPYNVTKEGLGEVIFAAANLYRGSTTVNNGILQIQNALALGTADGTAATGTIVNEIGGEAGTLQLDDPSGVGFTVRNELLTLNGAGVTSGFVNLGALDNLKGNNNWTGNVILGSPAPNGSDVTIGAESSDPLYKLTISGVVSDPNGPRNLYKVGAGNLVLTSANTYQGFSDIKTGILTIRDSKGLGSGNAFVDNGASLELSVDNIPDSVTGTTNTLSVSTPLTLVGSGVNNMGALFSESGINTYTGTLSVSNFNHNGTFFAGSVSAVGVAPDPNPTPNQNYFTNDYSLTVTGAINGPNDVRFAKVGPGQLILPNANTGLLGTFDVRQGWVTIENSNSLGGRIYGRGDTAQSPTIVEYGAALHLKAPAGQTLTVPQNLTLFGLGITHTDPLINQQGALENVDGINTVTGNVALGGQVGVGVERVFGTPSQLTLTGTISQAKPVLNVGGSASGSSAESDNIIDTGSTSGTVTVNYNMYAIPDSLDIYYGINGQGGVNIYSSGGPISGSGTVTVNYGPGTTTIIEIIIDKGGGQPGTVWDYTATVTPSTTTGGFLKLGSQLLAIQGDGTYTGNVDIKQGVLLDQSSTGLGQSLSSTTTTTTENPTTTTVEAGAALVLGSTIPLYNGGIQSGFGVWGEHLILNGSGNTTLGTPIAPLDTVGNTNLTAPGSDLLVPADFLWHGPVTLNTSSPIDVGPNTRLTIEGTIDDQTNTAKTGSDLIKTDTGELLLSGSNTYRGTTYVGSSASTAVQTVTLTGTSGTFTLTFNGQTTGVLAYNVPASGGTGPTASVQNALNALKSISGVGGSVTVTQSGGVYTVTFGGALAGLNVPLLTATAAGGASAAIAPAGPAVQGGILTVANSQALGTAGIGEVQTVTVTGTGGTFALTFNGQATAALPYNVPASGGTGPTASLQNALNALTAINGVGGTVTVTVTVTQTSSIYTITLGGTLAGFNQPQMTATTTGAASVSVNTPTVGAGGTVVTGGAQIQLQGSITVAAEPLIVQGQGVSAANTPNVPLSWFAAGPAPINNAQTAGSEQVTGRVTGIAVDPSDPNVIYVATAGGGAWKTINGGQTWLPLFDSGPALFSGAIAVAPSDPRVIYLGTGEADNSIDSYYGTGVYKSTDSGKTWTLLVDSSATPNPLYGQGISKIVVDPYNANQIFVASTDLVANGPNTTGAPGVWRYNGSAWFDLTAVISNNRATQKGKLTNPPNTPGPDDDYEYTFPQSNATWSDLQLVYIDFFGNGSRSPVLYAALGTASGDLSNAVYRAINADTNAPTWYVGDPGSPPVADSRPTGEFPAGSFTTFIPRNGTIKFSAFVTQNGDPGWNQVTIYAAIANPRTGALLEIQKSSDGGKTWAATTTAPANYLGNQGWYDNTILAVNANTVYVGGQEVDPGTHKQHVFVTTDGGATAGNWVDISVDSKGNGPHTDDHALAVDSQGRILIGNDGGVWRLDPANGNLWTDINGNLAITTLNGVTSHPTDPNIVFGGSQDNGTEEFTGTQQWTWRDSGDGGLVRFDPKFPNIVYHVVNGFLVQSTDGGQTFPKTLLFVGGLYFPFLVDPVNTSRLLVGGGDLRESLDQGTSWKSLNPPVGVGALAAATYQGPFDNTGFGLIVDKGASAYDPDTLYISDYSSVYLTKNHGQSWVNRTSNLSSFLNLGKSPINDIEVDPSNENVAYVVSSVFGGAHVLKTSNAGLAWSDISAGLPNVPAWKLVIDPRNGNLYVGTDDGVWVLTGGTGSWQRLGAGLPNVQVVDLDLNQNLNILSAASYGRSMFQVYLDNPQATTGGLRALSGSSVWGGPVLLAGATTIQADGTQAVQNGLATAQLTINGVISDLVYGANSKLTKAGGGTLVLAGANTYGGQTEVTAGVLAAANPSALGSPNQGTTVDVGAALELESNLNAEPITINGDGASQLNGHNTGALRNISGNNTYNGVLTLGNASGAGEVTVGVDSGNSLTIASPGMVTDGVNSITLTKELTGTLVLASANNYKGGTDVNQGIVNVQNGSALGAAGTTTTVLDGAQVQVQGGITVPSEILRISGTGISGTGALESVGGANRWESAITLAQDPGQNPTTTPGTSIAIGALYTTPADGLTLDGPVGQAAGLTALGIQKVGTGTVSLNDVNTYQGVTTVAAGALRVQNGAALGTVTNGTVVQAGAALELDGSAAAGGNLTVAGEPLTLNGAGTAEVQTVTVTGTAGTFTLTFNGQTTSASPALPYNATAAQVQAALNALSSISGVGGNVTVTQAGNVYYVLFGGTLGGADQPPMTATGTSGTTVLVGTARDGGTGALRNVSGNNTWTGTVTLQTASALGADGGTQLIVTGTVQDTAPAAVPASTLTKVGPGTVVFPNANTYTGTTFVNAGVLNVRNAGALGGVVSEQQSFTVSGPLTGAFTLTFKGQTTASLSANYNDPNFLSNVQAALNGLSTIGGAGGYVTVAFNPAGTPGSTFTATFGGSLAGADQPQITATGANGTTVAASTVTDGSGGTVVNAGATLQVQGGITVTTEPLTLNGPGFNNAGALENASGNNTWATPVTLGSNASVGVDVSTDTLTLSQQITDNGSKFGVTEVGPGSLAYTGGAANTYTGLTQVNQGTLLLDKAPVSEVQTITVLGSSGTFTVTFNGQTTGSLAYNVPASGGVGPTASLQNALNALSTIGGAGGSVTVTASGNVYTVTFGGSLALANQPQMTAAGSGGATPIVYTVTDGNPSPAAFGGNLTVGDTLPGNATARWLLANEAPTGTTATVNSDGTLDLNDLTQTLAALVVNDGLAKTGVSNTGNLTVNSLTMTGGTVTTGTAGSLVTLAGDVTATSSATQTATINGGGSLSENGVNRTFNVSRGTGAPTVDLDLVAQIVPGSGTPGLTKSGSGVLQIDPNNTSTGFGKATVTAGTLRVDGKITDVSLSAGSTGTAALGGTGTVNNVTADTTNANVISPGNGVGTLKTQSVTLNSASTFFVTLTNTAGNSQLNVPVSGTVTLNGAKLDAAVAPDVVVGHSPFTILQTAGTGVLAASQFAQGTDGFVGGRKFAIAYTTTPGASSVVLTPETMKATLSLASSEPTASVYGETVTYTATVTPEPGAGPVPDGDFVEFTFDGGSPVDVTTKGGKAQFTPPPGSLTVTPAGSPHTITAKFLGDGNFSPTGVVTVNQTVNKAATQYTITQDVTPEVYGHPPTLTVTISAVSPGAGYPNGPTGTVSFTVDGATPANSPVTLNPSGSAQNLTGVGSITLGVLSVNDHQVHISYTGDGNFLPVSSASNYVLTVQKANTSVTVSGPGSAPSYGQKVTFTATVAAVAPGSGTPADGELVTFLDGGNALGTAKLTNGVATLSVSTLNAGTHTINVQYAGDSNFNGNTGSLSNFVVNQAATTTALTESMNPAAVGQPVTLTATVTNQAGTTTPVGSVTFVIDGVSQSPVAVDGTGHASMTYTFQTKGNHTLAANYSGSTNYAPSGSGTVNESVLNSGAVTLGASTNPAVYGQVVTFTAVVAGSSPGSPTPSGFVTFVIDSASQAPVGLNGAGQASLPFAFRGLGVHTVTANYSGDANYPPATATMNETVTQAGSGTTIFTSGTPSVYGQPVTFTATVSAASPSTGTPTGTVTFVVDNVSQAPVGLNASGQASITLSTLPAGGHGVSATYSGDANYTVSAAPAVAQTVTQAGTTTTLTLSSGTVAFGDPVTFTATVSAASPSAATPTGTVTFIVDGQSQGDVSLNAYGQASFSVSTLGRGTHTVQANYDGNANFAASTEPTQTVSVVANFHGSPNQVWVNQVYSDLLNRPADPAGLTYWTDQIEEFDVPRSTVALGILNSDEYRSNYIIKLYHDLLNRTPILPDLEYHLNFLRAGGTYEQLTANFLSSPENYLRNGEMDYSVYTTAVYKYVLGHAPSPDALNYWVNFLQSNSRYAMALQVLQSAEKQGNFVRKLYENFLGREPNGSPNGWFVALQQGARDEDVIVGILASPEYFNRLAPLHNTQPQEQSWITHVYADLLGRAIDGPSTSYWVSAQEQGTSRLRITEEITNSAAYRARLITNLFQTMLNRSPSASDLATYQNYLEQGGSDEGMKAIILGSSEYYFGRGAGNAYNFLNAVYHDVLQRPLDSAGVGYWGGKLAAGEDRTALALEMLGTFDAEVVLVQNDYYATLRHAAGTDAVNYWTGQLNAGYKDEYVLASLAATDEYFARSANG